MNDSVVNANEAGGWHRGRLVLRTVSKDEDHIAFNNDHVEHDMNDGLDENDKMKRNQEEVKAHPQKPRRLSPWRLQERQVKNFLIEAQRTKKTDRTVGDGHHARCLHPVVEAGSIVLQVSNNMSEGKKRR